MAGSPGFSKIRSSDPIISRVQDMIADQVNPAAKAWAATPIMGAPPPPWVGLSLLADFVNAGGGEAVAASHLDALGYVHLKGLILTAAGTAAGTLIMTLPAGQRPKETQRFAVRGNTATAQFLKLLPTGALSHDIVIAAGGTLSLSISYLAEQ